MQSGLSLLFQILVLQTELCPGNHVLWATSVFLVGYMVDHQLINGFRS